MAVGPATSSAATPPPASFWALIAARNAGIAVHKDTHRQSRRLPAQTTRRLRRQRQRQQGHRPARPVLRQTRRLRRLQPPLPRPQLARCRHPRLPDPRVFQHRPQGDRRRTRRHPRRQGQGSNRTNPSSGNPATRSHGSTTRRKPPRWFCWPWRESKPGLAARRSRRPITAAIPWLLRLPDRPRPRPGRRRAGHLVRPWARNRRPTWKSPCRSTARRSASSKPSPPSGLNVAGSAGRTRSSRTRTSSSSRCAAAAATPMPPPCSDSPPTPRPPATRCIPGIDEWQHLHAPLEYRGKPIPVASTSPVKNLENGQRVNVRLSDRPRLIWYGGRWFMLDIPLPAGARLVEGSISVSDNLRCEVHPTSLRVYFVNRCPSVSYELTGYVPGKFRILPARHPRNRQPGIHGRGPRPRNSPCSPPARNRPTPT